MDSLSLVSGEFQLWVAETDVMVMAAITEVADYPAGRIGSVVLLGGWDLDRCIAFLDTMEAWARSLGCNTKAWKTPMNGCLWPAARRCWPDRWLTPVASLALNG